MGSPREAGSEHGPLAHFFSVFGDNKIGERMENKGLLKGRSVYICMWTLMHTPLCVLSGFCFFGGGRGVGLRSQRGGALLHSFCCHIRLCLHICVYVCPRLRGLVAVCLSHKQV